MDQVESREVSYDIFSTGLKACIYPTWIKSPSCRGQGENEKRACRPSNKWYASISDEDGWL